MGEFTKLMEKLKVDQVTFRQLNGASVSVSVHLMKDMEDYHGVTLEKLILGLTKGSPKWIS